MPAYLLAAAGHPFPDDAGRRLHLSNRSLRDLVSGAGSVSLRQVDGPIRLHPHLLLHPIEVRLQEALHSLPDPLLPGLQTESERSDGVRGRFQIII